MLVFDATPLIYLATVDRLALATERDRECLVPTSVAEEVLVPEQPDARRIERRIEAGDLTVRDAPTTDRRERLADNDSLSRADADVLALADALGGVAVMDEQYGRDVAAVEDIPTTGTAALVIDAVRSGDIAAATGPEIIDDLVEAGWYCSPALYSRIRRRLEDEPG